MAIEPDLTRLQTSHPRLAAIFARHWGTSLGDYAPLLYQAEPQPLEPAWGVALQTEWHRLGQTAPQANALWSQLQQTPVLQTSHHLTPTHGPSFLSLDLQCLAGLPPGQTYLVGACSGVAFSNTAWSGALCFGQSRFADLLLPGPALAEALKSQTERAGHSLAEEQRLSLIPSRWRDQLLFGQPLPERLRELKPQFTPAMQRLLGDFSGDYADFAATTASRIQRQITGRELLVFDLPRVVAHYLALLVEAGTPHPLLNLLQSPQALNLAPLAWMGNVAGKKSFKVEPWNWDGDSLQGEKSGVILQGWSALQDRLLCRDLCPGVSLVFLCLLHLGIKALGSFNQVEYLADLRGRATLMNLRAPAPLGEELTTGRWLFKGQPTYPLDLALQGKKLNSTEFLDLTMGEFWEFYRHRLSRHES